MAVAGAWLGGIDGTLAAWLVLALGALLVLSAFTRGARWLALPAVAFAVAVAVIAAAHVDLHGGLGERTYRPQRLSEVRAGYRLGAGHLEVDLRGIAFPPGTTRLHVRLGMGELVVLVPRDVCVATSAQLGAGYVGALEQRSGGLDVDWAERPVPPSPRTPRLVLDGNVGLGALLVADHPIERDGNGWGGWGDWGGGGGGWFGSHVHRDALGTNVACDAPVAAGSASAADIVMRPPNVTVLLTGIAVLVLGVLLVLDANGAIDLRFAYTAAVLVGALGAILLAGGLAGRGRARGRGHDHGSDQG